MRIDKYALRDGLAEPRRVLHRPTSALGLPSTLPVDSFERGMSLQMMSRPSEGVSDTTAAIAARRKRLALHSSDLMLLGMVVIVLDQIDSGFRNDLAGFVTHDRRLLREFRQPLARG